MPSPDKGLRGSHMYEHLAIVSAPAGDNAAETRMPMGPGLRNPSGALYSSPLGLAFEHGASMFLFDERQAVPIQISIHARGNAQDAAGVIAVTKLVRAGRSVAITDGIIATDTSERAAVGYGYITWLWIEDVDGFADEEPDSYPWGGPTENIMDAVGIAPLDDRTGCRLERVTDATAGPGRILHAGLLQMLAENAALIASERETGISGVATDCTYNFLRAGRTGPFVARAESLGTAPPASRDYRVVVTDEGSDHVSSVSYVTVRS